MLINKREKKKCSWKRHGPSCITICYLQ